MWQKKQINPKHKNNQKKNIFSDNNKLITCYLKFGLCEKDVFYSNKIITVF